jgi:hypothetical protein
MVCGCMFDVGAGGSGGGGECERSIGRGVPSRDPECVT